MAKINYSGGEVTCSDNYPSAPSKVITIDCDKVTVIIKNTHASYGLTYKVVGYPDLNDTTVSKDAVQEATLAAGAVAVHTITDVYDGIAVLWKNATSGQNAKVKAWVNTEPRK